MKSRDFVYYKLQNIVIFFTINNGSLLSLFVVNCRYIGYFSKCSKWWKVVRGCHARYQDFMVFGNQLKPAYYGIYYLHHLKAPRKGKKLSSYCSKFNEVKQWVKSGILMDGS